jgi:hypothetical protein
LEPLSFDPAPDVAPLEALLEAALVVEAAFEFDSAEACFEADVLEPLPAVVGALPPSACFGASATLAGAAAAAGALCPGGDADCTVGSQPTGPNTIATATTSPSSACDQRTPARRDVPALDASTRTAIGGRVGTAIGRGAGWRTKKLAISSSMRTSPISGPGRLTRASRHLQTRSESTGSDRCRARRSRSTRRGCCR